MGAVRTETAELRSLEGRLAVLAEEYGRLLAAVSAADAGPARPAALKRLGELEPVMRAKARRDELVGAAAEARRLAAEAEDAGMRELAEEEVSSVRAELERLDGELRALLFPPDPLDRRDAIMEIRQGTGGDEAALFARDLFRMYARFAERRGFRLQIYDTHGGTLGGLREVVFAVRGEGAYGLFRREQGVHRVQRVPDTEASGRVHTSAATVAVFPEMEETEVAIEFKDLRVDTFCASGAGGQHVNKTASAVRITHLPTGLVVSCQDERSQGQNRSRAMEILRARLAALYESQKKSKIDDDRKAQVKSGDRSEKVRTYNFPQNRVTDHRANVTSHALDRLMEGELEDFLRRVRESGEAT